MRRRSHKKRSFTLIELLVVVIIIGILAGIAIPRFIKTSEKARGEEALTNLRLIFAGERMYRLDNRIYSSRLVTGDDPEVDGGLFPDYIEDPTTPARQKYFTFTLWRSGDYKSFTATATRNTGIYSTDTITIDQDETWGGDWLWLP